MRQFPSTRVLGLWTSEAREEVCWTAQYTRSDYLQVKRPYETGQRRLACPPLLPVPGPAPVSGDLPQSVPGASADYLLYTACHRGTR